MFNMRLEYLDLTDEDLGKRYQHLFISGLIKLLFLLDGYDMIIMPRNQIEPDTEDVFLPSGKNAPSILASFGFGSYDCVAANEALRFSCVVSFGAAHFFVELSLQFFVGNSITDTVGDRKERR